jgi:hypothetical protein
MPALIDAEVRSLPYDETIDLELAMGRIALTLAAWVRLGEHLDPPTAEAIAHFALRVEGGPRGRFVRASSA